MTIVTVLTALVLVAGMVLVLLMAIGPTALDLVEDAAESRRGHGRPNPPRAVEPRPRAATLHA
ncbi:hypothetical protein [Propionicicella superfundia]|uniref:hypothetical protein n=1 Tax=Propionicicella superfundia TaxID=348582 RepID=UPI0004221D37|nr:hypothetical protein [Propionicicella superfundia]